ncbi:MAG: YHS domain-containing protein [Desulfobacterales bacterium]|nr:MAG: YHS domain-containing protein [Desulfobacterales bacterium]
MKSNAKSSNTVIDPVCGMQVDACATDLVAEYRDRMFYFCAHGCLQAFEKNPDKYFAQTTVKKKGWWGRYLDRLNKSTDGKAIKCH